MSKKKNLAAALHKDIKKVTPIPVVASASENTLVQMNFRIDPAAKQQLEYLRLETGAKSLQVLFIEAMNDLFQKHGKDRIA